MIAFESYEQVIAAARAAQSGKLNEYLSSSGLRDDSEIRRRNGHAEIPLHLAYCCPKGGYAYARRSIKEVSIDGGITRRGRTPLDDDEPMQFCGICVTR